MLRVAVAGCYSTNNPYDEAELTAVVAALRALSPGLEITVFSQGQRKTDQLPEVRTANRWNPIQLIYSILHADMILSEGNIRDDQGIWPLIAHFGILALARLFGKPVVSYGQGVGPLKSFLGRKLVRSACNKIDLITVRDGLSKEALLEIGVNHPPVVVTADPVFTINPSQFDRELGRTLLERIRFQSLPDSSDNGNGGTAVQRGIIEADTTNPGGFTSVALSKGIAPSVAVAQNKGTAPGKEAALSKAAILDGRQEAAAPAGRESAPVGEKQGTPARGQDASAAQASITASQSAQSSATKDSKAATEQRPLLGIILQNIEGNEKYKKTVASAADRLVQDGWEVLFIPFDFAADIQVCQEVSWIMQQKNLLLKEKLSLVECFSLLGELDLLLGMKLPALKMASVMRTPCVGVVLDNKISRFLEMTGQTSAGTLEELQDGELYQRIKGAWEGRKETITHLDQLLIQLRQQSWESAGIALSYFYSRQPSKRYDSRLGGRSEHQGKASRAAHR